MRRTMNQKTERGYVQTLQRLVQIPESTFPGVSLTGNMMIQLKE